MFLKLESIQDKDLKVFLLMPPFDLASNMWMITFSQYKTISGSNYH